MKKPFLKRKAVETWLKVIIGLSVTLATSRVATSNPVVNEVVIEAIEQTGATLIDVLTTSKSDSIHTDSTSVASANQSIYIY